MRKHLQHAANILPTQTLGEVNDLTEKAWWETAEPIHGEKFIEVAFAEITTFNKYNNQQIPLTDAAAVKIETLENTLWSIEHDIYGKPFKYWQYSKKYNITPIAFELREVKLLNKDKIPLV